MPEKDNLARSRRRRGRFSMYLENRHAAQAKLGPSLSFRFIAFCDSRNGRRPDRKTGLWWAGRVGYVALADPRADYQ